ncbi:dTDP-4-dehydrorhamnose 3,5-epimerase [Methylococcales bacterium]|nr:dTDP-4-dehydrorhamnose 3,5-epimerase [Methylococcales bacterium]
MNILPTSLSGLFVVETTPVTDHRGAFARLFCERELAPILGGRHIAQINYSRTSAVGAVRGLHFQHPPHAEMKLVRCLRGRVWDVALDLRAASPTFLRWHAEELTPGNTRMMVIPEGFAHGFQVLEPDSELLYLHTTCYEPAAEDGLLCSDSRLDIAWPLAIRDLSLRDANHSPLTIEFPGIVV